MPDFEGVEFDTTDWFKSITLDMTFVGVDPELLALLTGGVLGTKPKPKPTFAIEAVSYIPVRRRAWRVVWEWITRKPRQYTQHHYYIPHATMGEVDSDG